MSTRATHHQRYDESELLSALKSGSQKAFEQLYDRFAPSLLGILVCIVHDREQAEDLLQDSFVKIWNNLPKYEPNKGRLFTWMLTITRNTALDYLKTSKPVFEEIDAFSVDVKASTTPAYHTIGITDWVKSILCPEYSQVINLVYFQGYTHEEVADEFGFPLGTVKTRVRRALQHLRTSM